MSDLTNFLSGSVVPPQPTGSDTSSSFPLWLQSLVYNLSNTASNLSQSPYQSFPGPTVAAPSSMQSGAWNLAGQNVGNWQSPLNAAQGLTQAGATPLDPAAAAGYSNAATGNVLGNAGQVTGALNAATQAAIPGYMNPYTSAVAGGLESNLNTNLMQNILPNIQDRAVAAGQVASPQQMQAENNAIYQNQQALGQSLAPALEQGYNSALSAAQGAAGTGLSTAGNLYGGALNTAAQQKANQLTGGAQIGQLGALGQQLGAADVSELGTAGQQQTAQEQANINAALTQFTNQQQYPYQQLGFLSNIIRGVPYGTTTQTAGLTPASSSTYAPSPVATGIGATTAASALGLGAKKGGHVTAKRKGALPARNQNRRRGALSLAA
jgi:hypothetical protein